VSMSPQDKPDALSELRTRCANAKYEEDLKAGAEKENTES